METTVINTNRDDKEEAVTLRRDFFNTGRGLGKETMKKMPNRMAGPAYSAKEMKEYESCSSYVSTDVIKEK